LQAIAHCTVIDAAEIYIEISSNLAGRLSTLTEAVTVLNTIGALRGETPQCDKKLIYLL
jgi:hypothetical protein